MNSVFEALLHCSIFVNWMAAHAGSGCQINQCLACALHDLAAVYWDGNATNRKCLPICVAKPCIEQPLTEAGVANVELHIGNLWIEQMNVRLCLRAAGWISTAQEDAHDFYVSLKGIMENQLPMK